MEVPNRTHHHRKTGQNPLTLETNLELLPLIMDNIPQAVFWKDRDLVYIGCNQAFAEDAGLDSPEQIIGKTDYDLPWTDQAESYRSDDAQVLDSGEAKINYEEPQTSPTGEITWLRTSKIPVRGESGEVVAVLGMYEDITEYKNAQLISAQSEQLLYSFINNFPDGVWAKDTEGRFVLANRYIVEEIAGTEVIGKTVYDTMPKENADFVWASEKHLLENGEPIAVEEDVPHADGKIYKKTTTKFPLYDTEGNITGVGGVLFDITERKKAEEALRENEDRFRRFTEATAEGLVFHEEGTIVDLNPAALTIFGYTDSSDLLSRNLMEFVLPEYHQLILEKMQLESVEPYRIEGIHKDGHNFPIETSTRTYELGDKTIRATSVRDITERQRAEQKIATFQALVENAADAIAMSDLQGKISFANRATYELLRFDYEKQELIGRTSNSLIPLQEQGDRDESVSQILAAGGATNEETTISRSDGSKVDVTVTVFPVLDASGQPTNIGAILHDITERKNLQTQVQEAFERRGYQVQISTEISQEIAEAAELTELFDRVVDLTKERLGYYHTQLLRYDPVQDAVVLISGYGETGQQMAAEGHRMPLGSGLIGTAAATGETVMRPDLAADPDWHANPLLPDTRGEVAVPIKLGDEILGVLDVQSNHADALTEDDQLLLEGLCGQIAIAMEQTRLRQEMTERLDEINRLYRSMSREGWKEYQTSTSLPKGFQYDQGGVRGLEGEADSQFLVATPLTVPGGHTVGTFAIADDPDNPLSPEDQAFLEQVSEQVALSLESARLTEQTQMALTRTDELYGISQAINEADSEAEILEALAQPAMKNGAISAILMYLDLDKAGTPEWTEIVADWRVEGKAPIPVGSRFYLPEMPLSKLWMADPENPLLISDVRTDPRIDDIARGLMEQGGSLALVIIPLTRGGEQIATLIFNWDQTHEFSSRENETYHAIIDLASPAVQSRRLFEQTQTSLAETQSLYRFNEAISSQSELEHIYKEVAQMVCEEVGFSGSWIAIYNPENQTLQGVTGVNMPENLITQSLPLDEITPGTLAAKMRQTVIVNDPQKDERMADIPADLLARMGKAIALPIMAGEELIGAIAATRQSGSDIGDREERVIQIVANQLSIAIERTRLFEQTQTAFEAVQESQEQLSEALEIAKLGYWEYDFANDEFILTDNFYAIFHTTAEKMGGYRMSSEKYSEKFVYPEDSAMVGEEIGRAIASTDPNFTTQVEHRILYQDGGVGYISVNINLEKDEDGNILRWWGANQDITERWLAFNAVRESEEQLGEALEIAKLGNFEYDVENDIFTFNDHFYAIFHTTAEEVGGYQMTSADYAQRFVYPDDMDMVGGEIGKALSSTERHYNALIEHRIIYADGEIGHISVNVHVERDEDGNITRYYGANQDITERKVAEEAVRQAQERAQTILETVTIPMVITRLSDNILTFANEPAAEIVGLPMDELVNSPAPNFYRDPDERNEFVSVLQEQGFVNNMQVQLTRGDGSTFYALLSARVFVYQGDQSILTTITDISERIAAQEATAKRAAELATVAELGTAISTVLEEQPLIETVVQLTRERFNLYHCHIFLADEKNQTLQVEACGWEEDSPHAGTVEAVLIHTDQEQSLVARAARDQKAVIVNDVQAEPDWLQNELLPNTRSEMAIPMVAGNQVLGVLDVQANEANRFDEEDISIMTTLASQVAVALQNARTYAQTQQQAEHEAMINLISQRIQSTTSVENALQVAIRELGRALGAKRANVQLGLSQQQKPKK